MSRILPRLVVVVIVLAIAFMPLVAGDFTVSLINRIGITTLVVLGLVLLTGAGGITSFGQAAFVGIAAYTSGWLTTTLQLSPWLGLICALLVTGLAALIIGMLTLRLGGHFLALSTIAWGIAVPATIGNIDALGRHAGMTGIPAIHVGSLSLAEPRHIYYLIWLCVGLSFAFSFNMYRSRVGRAMRSLRGGPVLLGSIGADVYYTKIKLFLVAALLAGLAGWLYAHMYQYISPTPFGVEVGIKYLLMAVIGGLSSLSGALVGSTLVIELRNVLQPVLSLITQHAPQVSVIVFFTIFILVMEFARGGAMGLLNNWWTGSMTRNGHPRAPHDRDIMDVRARLPRQVKPEVGTKILSMEDAVKRFGGLTAVNGVDLNVYSGEIVGLVGPNGAGKTTVFNLITRTIGMTSGRLVFLGKDISRKTQRSVARMGMARTFQHVRLRGNMSLLDNVAIGAYSRAKAGVLRAGLRLNRAEERRITREARIQLDRVGLGDRVNMKVVELPLGSQRVLEIARALAADPTLLILDEPAAGLRRKEKIELVHLLRNLRDEGITILIVEHDMEFVMNLVDRLIVMNFGSKLAEGAPEFVRAHEKVRAAYLGGLE